MDYPQYRSITGFNRHYKIVSANEFIEAYQRNNEWFFQQVIAEQYPEKLRIQDMLKCEFTYEKAAPEVARLFPNY